MRDGLIWFRIDSRFGCFENFNEHLIFVRDGDFSDEFRDSYIHSNVSTVGLFTVTVVTHRNSIYGSRFQWPSGPRQGSAADSLPELRV